MRSPLLAFAIVFLALAAGSCGGSEREHITVHIGDLTVDAEVARTAEDRSQGLSGRASLGADEGMLFVFEEERIPSFWMRQMRFSIDILWIDDARTVVDISADLPTPEPGTTDADLPLYSPSTDALFALEVNAGVAAEAGIQPGDAVAFDREP